MSSKVKVDRTNCCVYGCHTSRMKENVSFHLFPRKNSGFAFITNAFGAKEKVDRRKAWEHVLRMGKPATYFMRVCAKHFTKEDYLYESSRKPALKKTVIPSQNLPEKTFARKTSTAPARLQRREKRQTLREATINSTDFRLCCDGCDNNVEAENHEESVLTIDNLDENERSPINVLLSLQSEHQLDQNINIDKADKNVQVTSGDLFTSYASTIRNNNHLNSLTGISNFNLLKTITSLIVDFYPDSRSRKMSVEDRIILVFMKLKMSLKFKVLSILFHISPSTCRIIFEDYIQCIANVLRPCIVWPSIDECRGHMPKCFKDFQSVRIVLGCIEIPVQRARCRCCRIKTYSHDKGRNTLKFMTGVSPAGMITYVSTCYGGRASDKAIFEQSGLIEKLEPHIDSIMVDKGFAIKDICTERFIKIVQPYFLRKKKQFSASEAQMNDRVSRARVHVERTNQRIRIFEIFNSPLPWNLINYINDIFVIACSIVNLQTPILAEDKFN